VAAQSGASLNPATTVTTQAVGDAPVVGSLVTYAREDHKHGREAFGTVKDESNTGYGAAAANGVALTVARSDHGHGNPFLSGSAPTGLNRPGAAAAPGVSLLPTRDDHVHGWGAALAALDMGNFKIVNQADPTAAQDSATKNYVDNAVTGMTWKNPARALAATNITQSATQTIDGVAVIVGDRVLCTGQTTTANNGLWVVAAGAWTRATDADSSAELVNMAVYIAEGTTYADTAWVCTTNAPITVGTTGLTFAQFAGTGAIVAGAGLTQSGNTVNVIAGDTSLTVNADEVHVNTAVIATVASVSAGYQPIDTDLTALAALATTGIEVRTGAGTQATRSVAGTLPISVANGDGVAANPTVSVATFGSAAAGVVPASGGGTTNFLRADGTWAPATVAGAAAKYAGALTGTASPEVVTHNLNTRDVQVTVLNGATPYTAVEVDWDATTVNTVTVRYNPNLGAGYRVVVVG
jgi:hypothetical protein